MDDMADRQGYAERVKDLMAIQERILGERIPTTCRVARFVWARAMVAYQMRMEGYTLHQVGAAIGKNHSDIVHLHHKMKDALDYGYAYTDIVDKWKQFQNMIRYDIHN